MGFHRNPGKKTQWGAMGAKMGYCRLPGCSHTFCNLTFVALVRRYIRNEKGEYVRNIFTSATFICKYLVFSGSMGPKPWGPPHENGLFGKTVRF